MTGREKIQAAFSAEGTPEIPAVICYEDIFMRDHWADITRAPWWHAEDPDVDHQLAWRRDLIAQTGQDWFELRALPPREVRQAVSVRPEKEGVFWVDSRNGERVRLERPRIGGWRSVGAVESVHPPRPPKTAEELDLLIPDPAGPEADIRNAGRDDLARRLLQEFGTRLCPRSSAPSPFWLCYEVWGFEGLMMNVATEPGLVRHACEKLLRAQMRSIREAAGLGASVVWLEDCLTDMIDPGAFCSLNLPFIRDLTAEIRTCGMKSIYYFCGDPRGKWQYLFDTGADALALEEGKKGFTNDIDEIVDRVNGRLAVLGNLDAIELLPHGSDEALRFQISRQLAAGRRNGSRFIMSLGSPVTPGTPVERVRRYCELAHELGRR